MAKLIKKGEAGNEDAAATPAAAAAPGAQRRAPIIGRDAYAAKSEAESIRAKAQAGAGDIVAQAQEQAGQIIAQAQQEAVQLKEQAKLDGAAEAKEEAASAVSEAVAMLVGKREAVEAQLVPQLKDLALAIARKILGHELSSSPDTVVKLVRQALADKARQRTEIFLRVHPDDLERVRGAKTQLLEVLSRANEIGIQADPNVSPHGVIIETDAGRIDAQLDTQLAIFEKVLKTMP